MVYHNIILLYSTDHHIRTCMICYSGEAVEAYVLSQINQENDWLIGADIFKTVGRSLRWVYILDSRILTFGVQLHSLMCRGQHQCPLTAHCMIWFSNSVLQCDGNLSIDQLHDGIGLAMLLGLISPLLQYWMHICSIHRAIPHIPYLIWYFPYAVPQVILTRDTLVSKYPRMWHFLA